MMWNTESSGRNCLFDSTSASDFEFVPVGGAFFSVPHCGDAVSTTCRFFGMISVA